MKHTRRLFFVATLIFCINEVSAQKNVGINTSSPDASAALDVTSTTQGVLVPRMTQSQRSAISNPATGLLVWQTDATQGFYYNAGPTQAPNWVQLGAKGDTGQGVPPGGASGQVLSKIDGANFNTQWVNPENSSVGGISFVRSDDIMVSVSAPSYVDALSVNLEAGKKYWIRGVIKGQKAANNWALAAYKFAYSGTAVTPTGITSSTYGDPLVAPGTILNSNGTPDFDWFQTMQDLPFVKFDFHTIIDSQTAGTFKLQSTRATGSTDDYFIKAGSFIIATPIQ
nr:hypothetical protein [uncultured Dyadobacter sp.]